MSVLTLCSNEVAIILLTLLSMYNNKILLSLYNELYILVVQIIFVGKSSQVNQTVDAGPTEVLVLKSKLSYKICF